MKIEFDYGGRTFLVEKQDIFEWNAHVIKLATFGYLTLEKDLHSGEDIYVNWDRVGVLRRVVESAEEPRPEALTPPSSSARPPEPTELPTVAGHETTQVASEPAKQSLPSDKDAEKLAEASDPNTAPSRLNQLARMSPAARILAARNPASPPSLLTWLKELKDPTIDEALRAR